MQLSVTFKPFHRYRARMYNTLPQETLCGQEFKRHSLGKYGSSEKREAI